jgi:hypothetical protein
MKRVIWSVFDASMIGVIVFALYFHFFIDSKRAVGGEARLIYLRLFLLVLAVAILPFRAKYHPRIVNFALFDRSGKRRSSLFVPGACVALSLAVILISIRLLLMLINNQ